MTPGTRYAGVEPTPATPWIKYDLVGPVGETGDYVALDRRAPEMKAGDLYAIGTAGAYGAVHRPAPTITRPWSRRFSCTATSTMSSQAAVRGRPAHRHGQLCRTGLRPSDHFFPSPVACTRKSLFVCIAFWRVRQKRLIDWLSG